RQRHQAIQFTSVTVSVYHETSPASIPDRCGEREIRLSMTRSLSLTFWFVLALTGAAVLAMVAAYWGETAELLNRSLIVAATGWLLLRSRGALQGRDSGPHLSALGLATLAIALAAMPPAWFLTALVGPRPVLLWWLTVGWLVSVATSVLI